jgi:hypothetical protein
MVKKYGADALRLYEMFIGDYSKDAAWNEDSLNGCAKFLDRVYNLGESFEDIDGICKKFGIKNYTINPDGSIDVDEEVDLYNKNLKKLPLKFNKVNVWFDCSFNQLTTLEGSPVEVNDGFDCSNNKLTSFEFTPKIIRSGFDCRFNNIKTFEYFPSFIKYYFWCNGNPIEEVWDLFQDTTKIELLNDFDVFRDEDTDEPVIIMDRLNDFLLTIGKPTVEKVNRYKNI